MIIHKASKAILNSMVYHMNEIFLKMGKVCMLIECIFLAILSMKLWYASYAMYCQANFMWRASSIYNLWIVWTTIMLIMISKV